MNDPDQRLHWEDFSAGESVDFGETLLTAEAIIAFAREFDPAPEHLGEAPDDSEFTAGDWHSCAMLMRMMCDDYLMNAAGTGAPAVEHVRWFGSVRPGDVLTARRTPLETRASKSRPRIGIVRMYQEVFNQHGELVMTWLPVQLYERRDPTVEPPPPASVPDPDSMKTAMRTPPALSARGPGDLIGAYEDIEIGEATDLGSHLFSKEEMLSYATRFNPQYFHADEAAAKASLYGGLIASGWHTGAMWNRHVVTHRLDAAEAVSDSGRQPARIGPSIDILDMKWSGPVRPGDTLAFSTKITGKSDLAEFPGWGVVTSFDEGVNQRGETVFSLNHRYWVERAK